MRGNPLFLGTKSNIKYEDDIFKGTKLHPDRSQDIRNVDN